MSLSGRLRRKNTSTSLRDQREWFPFYLCRLAKELCWPLHQSYSSLFLSYKYLSYEVNNYIFKNRSRGFLLCFMFMFIRYMFICDYSLWLFVVVFSELEMRDRIDNNNEQCNAKKWQIIEQLTLGLRERSFWPF